MKQLLTLLFLYPGLMSYSQVDSSMNNVMKELDKWAPSQKPIKNGVVVFTSQKLINTNTVEVLHKGAMEFKVIHNFYDMAGTRGGIHNFFGLDNAADVKIAFQIGLSDKLNIVGARTRGDQFQNVTELWELGFKYRFMQQMPGKSGNPVTITAYANSVVSAMKENPAIGEEYSFRNVSDRMSQMVQVMVARKFDKFSFQLSPTFVHTNFVIPGDDHSLIAIGAGLRIPITKNLAFITDYFHPFRSQQSKDSLNAKFVQNPTVYDKYGVGYDVLGVGFEIMTVGHIFHLNFTNATNILENRFIPRTLTSWGKGQFRWGFTIARNFILFRDK